MSAAEIITLIKKLPPDEREEVFTFVREETGTDAGAAKVRQISDEKFAEVAPQVFKKHRGLLRRLAQ